MIRKYDDYAVIIYTNQSQENLASGTPAAPFQYLVKPVEHEKLIQALDSAVARVDNNAGKSVLIKRKDGLANVGIHQIEYVEYKDHALAFYLSSGKVIESRVIHESFSWVVENILNDPRFVKPHASYAVNMDHVQSMSSREFEMDCGARIPISKRTYAQTKQQFISYMVERNGACVL